MRPSETQKVMLIIAIVLISASLLFRAVRLLKDLV